MTAILKRELRSFFITPIGYVYIGMFLTISSLISSFTTLQLKTYNTASYYTFLIFSFVVLIPLLTMRLFSEERKMRTEQMLLTAPVSITGMVLGKYLAALTVFASTLLFSCINLFPLYAIGVEERAGTDYSYNHIGPVTAEIAGRLIGVFLIGAAIIAIGTLISSLTENQLSAAVITIGVVLFMVGMGVVNTIGTEAEGTRLINNYVVRSVIDWISIMSRFNNFSNGIFDFAALLYYLSLTGVFIFLTIRVYDRRRWA